MPNHTPFEYHFDFLNFENLPFGVGGKLVEAVALVNQFIVTPSDDHAQQPAKSSRRR